MSNTIMAQCKVCNKHTKHTQPNTSHILHLILSIITAGLWVPAWILVALSNKSQAQCTVCGKTKGL